jgi:hypothetical protein
MTTATILEEFDNAFQRWGRAAPPVRADEDENSYTRRVARIAQKKNYLSYDEPVRRVNFNELPNHALPQFTKLLLDGIKRSVLRSDTVPIGEERQVFTRDENTGMATRSFVRADNRSFVCDMGRPCRRVDSIRTPAGAVLYRSAFAKRALRPLNGEL